MSEVKKPTTYAEQVDKLKNRGCIIKDEGRCKRILSNVGYYRLSAYFLPFKLKDDTYKEGITFDRIYHIYEFDRKLRNLIYGAIEVIEVYMRSSLSYFHSIKYGALGYLNGANFNTRHNELKFKENVDRETANNEKVLFVKHHLENYNGQFPLWVVSELFTFGMLSYFYSDLTTADKKQLAGKDYKDVVSWLRCCTDLRNICAHYGRLYYRIFPSVPSGFCLSENEKRRLWGAILTVKALYPSIEKWNNEFMPAIEALFEEYKADIDLKHIAFPQNWAEQLKKTKERRFNGL